MTKQNDSVPGHKSPDLQQYRSYLVTCAYNIVGIVAEAEDIVQDAFEKYMLGDYSTISSPKAYLARMVVNLAINRKKRMQKVLADYPGEWLPEPISTDRADGPINRKELISYSIMVMLEKLTPIQRAVFILKEAYDYDHAEIAELLGISVDNCRQLLSRARKLIKLPPVRTTQIQPGFMQQYIDYMTKGDTASLEALMLEEIKLVSDGGGKATAAINPLFGRNDVIAFLVGLQRKFHSKLEARILSVNNEPALVYYDDGIPVSCAIISVHGHIITELFFMRNPDKLKMLS